MVTIPARRSIFTTKRIFPYRNLMPNPELGTSPGWLPIDDDEHTFTKALQSEGYWTAQVSDNPHLAFTKAYEPFRKTFDHWRTIVGQSGFYRPPESVPIERGRRSGCRRSCATSATSPACASTWPTRAAARTRRRPVAARVYKDAADTARPGPAAPALRDGGRLLRPARAVEPPRSTSTCTATPGYEGQNIGVTSYGFAKYFTHEQLRPARRLRGRGHADRPLARPLHGSLLRARPRQDHRDRAALRPRLPARRARLHRQGALAAPPRAGPGAVHPRAPRRQGRRRGQQLLRLDPRRRPDGALDARHRSARAGWRARPLAGARRRAADREARVPLRRHVQPLLHPHATTTC